MTPVSAVLADYSAINNTQYTMEIQNADLFKL